MRNITKVVLAVLFVAGFSIVINAMDSALVSGLKTLEKEAKELRIDIKSIKSVRTFNDLTDRLRAFDSSITDRDGRALVDTIKSTLSGLENQIIRNLITQVQKRIEDVKSVKSHEVMDQLAERLAFIVDLTRGRLGSWQPVYGLNIISPENFAYLPKPSPLGHIEKDLEFYLAQLRKKQDFTQMVHSGAAGVLAALQSIEKEAQGVNIDKSFVAFLIPAQFNSLVDQLREVEPFLGESSAARGLFGKVRETLVRLEQQLVDSSISFLRQEIVAGMDGAAYLDVERLTEEVAFMFDLAHEKLGNWREGFHSSDIISPENFAYLPKPIIPLREIRALQDMLAKVKEEEHATRMAGAARLKR